MTGFRRNALKFRATAEANHYPFTHGRRSDLSLMADGTAMVEATSGEDAVAKSLENGKLVLEFCVLCGQYGCGALSD